MTYADHEIAYNGLVPTDAQREERAQRQAEDDKIFFDMLTQLFPLLTGRSPQQLEAAYQAQRTRALERARRRKCQWEDLIANLPRNVMINMNSREPQGWQLRKIWTSRSNPTQICVEMVKDVVWNPDKGKACPKGVLIYSDGRIEESFFVQQPKFNGGVL